MKQTADQVLTICKGTKKSLQLFYFSSINRLHGLSNLRIMYVNWNGKLEATAVTASSHHDSLAEKLNFFFK